MSAVTTTTTSITVMVVVIMIMITTIIKITPLSSPLFLTLSTMMHSRLWQFPIFMAPQGFVGSWPLFFSVSWSYTQSVGLLGRGISPSQDLYLHTEQHKHRINAHNTDIHASSEIRTHDPSVRASEDSSCLRPRGHCDWLRQFPYYNINPRLRT
jgi:hypothetical protein